MPHCYILYSTSLNRFYVGSTILEPKERLQNHLEQFYGNHKYTSLSKDWKIFLEITCNSIEQARKIEKHIKKMKSSKYIRNLRQYPEIVSKLQKRFYQED